MSVCEMFNVYFILFLNYINRPIYKQGKTLDVQCLILRYIKNDSLIKKYADVLASLIRIGLGLVT